MVKPVESPSTVLAQLLVRVKVLAELSRKEDLGSGDVTSSLINDSGAGRFNLLAKQPCVLAGRAVAQSILDVYGYDIEIEWQPRAIDGAEFDDVPVVLAELRGTVSEVLTIERVLLNFLQRLCGVATTTRQYVRAIEGTGAEILDTRKTLPGWRVLDKYAVRSGGGRNHRFGLYDAVLIKDNHLAGVEPARTAAVVFDMLNKAASMNPAPTFVEVEADTLEQVEQLFTVVGVDVVLLDNFSNDELRSAVAMRESMHLSDKIKLEASGGVSLDTVRSIAETGVDYISVGAITHSAAAIDLSLERVG